MFMGLGQVLNETQESQIILSTLRERLWCSADQRTGGNLEKECCRQAQAEVGSNSKTKILETWPKPFSRALYVMTLTWAFT